MKQLPSFGLVAHRLNSSIHARGNMGSVTVKHFVLCWVLVADCLVGTMSTSDFYIRYPFYPPYCSTPDEMEKRSVPPLQTSNRVGESRILHVTAIFRHGARTPWGNTLNCWEDYWTNPETGVWDCNQTSFASSGESLFEKRYDSLLHPPQLRNSLNGTCQVGQLLEQGYEQEMRNGNFIRDAYLYDGGSFDHDKRMRLLDVSKPTPWNEVALRSDDESRTILSGQLVFNGMLGSQLSAFRQHHGRYPVIPLHTADFQRDIVDPNERICPKLVEISNRLQQSQGFRTMDKSEENNLLRGFQRDVLKASSGRDVDAVDCLMTTICTDRPLPRSIDDYGRNSTEDARYGSNLFERLVTMNVKKYTYIIKANNAEYSKLGMGPLWYEIMLNISPHIHEHETATNKIALFSGHDTTIMPILAALDPVLWEDEDWPPYASMVLLEIHEVNIDRNTDTKVFRSNFAFRLIYNGVVLTRKVPGCEPDLELCDADVLVDLVKPFAKLDIDCSTKKRNIPLSVVDGGSGTNKWFLVILPTLGGCVGGLIVYFYLTQSLPFAKNGARRLSVEEEDGIILTTPRGNGFRDYDNAPDDGSLT